MNNSTQDTVALIARILLAAMFIISGFGKIGGFEGTAGYIASKGLPMPQVVAALTIALELGGGILLAVGYKARWVALALGVFSVIAAVIFHNFWAVEAAQKMGQQINFMKNITIAGGMLMVFAFGPGRLSVDKS
jgi:putative oxidoreductase